MKPLPRFLIPVFVLAALALGAFGVAFARELTNAEYTTTATDEVEFTGIVESINGNAWTIGGRTVIVDSATELIGFISVDQQVKVHASMGVDGSLAAREIELAGADAVENTNDNEDDDIFDNANANDNADDDIFDDANSNDNVDDDIFDNLNTNDNSDDQYMDDNSNDNSSSWNDDNSNDDNGSWDDDNSNDNSSTWNDDNSDSSGDVTNNNNDNSGDDSGPGHDGGGDHGDD